HRIPDGWESQRLDRYLAARFPYRSRAQWMELIRAGQVRVNGRTVRPSQRVSPGTLVEYRPSETSEPEVSADIRILHEDDFVLVVDKPPDLPLHPSGKYFRNTLLSVLLERRGETLDEPGVRVVHRLDRETSGVVVFGKSPEATAFLAAQFEHRQARKRYLALVYGDPPAEFAVEARLGPRAGSRIRKAVGIVGPGEGASARTVFRRLAGGGDLGLVEARPETGRLHQIRVHLQHAGYPVVGDKMYGPDEGLFLKLVDGETYTPEDHARLLLPRQALHAWRLTLRHPRTGSTVTWTAPVPEDMRELGSARGIDWDAALADPA
ncbi:MAG: RluA family pseudouridine synthase, partial [Candidatus Eisenbacteria bacterium]|nr:RluA family pseudouridine synthase [Candidatus Eisenbacteria bacterium]